MKIEITNGVETPVTKFFCSSPETDAFFLKKGVWSDEILAFCRKLERERDEARELHKKSLCEREAAERETDATLERAQKAERERDEARAIAHDLAVIASHCLGWHDHETGEAAERISSVLKRWKGEK